MTCASSPPPSPPWRPSKHCTWRCWRTFLDLRNIFVGRRCCIRVFSTWSQLYLQIIKICNVSSHRLTSLVVLFSNQMCPPSLIGLYAPLGCQNFVHLSFLNFFFLSWGSGPNNLLQLVSLKMYRMKYPFRLSLYPFHFQCCSFLPFLCLLSLQCHSVFFNFHFHLFLLQILYFFPSFLFPIMSYFCDPFPFLSIISSLLRF